MGDTEERYDRLINWLEYRLGELDSDDDGGILFGLFRGDDEVSERDTIKRLINNLKAKKTDHDQLITLRDEAGSKRSAVRDRIQSLRDEFEIAIDSVSEDIYRTESKRDPIKAEKANMKDPENDDSLVEFSPEQFASFSVSEPDNLSRDDVQRIKQQGEYNLKDIVDSPAWDESEVLLNIKNIRNADSRGN
jgi:biotin operon repressor